MRYHIATARHDRRRIGDCAVANRLPVGDTLSSAMSLPNSAGEPATTALQIGAPRLDFVIGEDRINLFIELSDDLGGHAQEYGLTLGFEAL
jgi:hypothetical protein